MSFKLLLLCTHLTLHGLCKSPSLEHNDVFSGKYSGLQRRHWVRLMKLWATRVWLCCWSDIHIEWSCYLKSSVQFSSWALWLQLDWMHSVASVHANKFTQFLILDISKGCKMQFSYHPSQLE
jgi:hypothetical protein